LFQETYRLLSEGQEELANFDEQFIDLDEETLENEATDFRVSFKNVALLDKDKSLQWTI